MKRFLLLVIFGSVFAMENPNPYTRTHQSATDIPKEALDNLVTRHAQSTKKPSSVIIDKARNRIITLQTALAPFYYKTQISPLGKYVLTFRNQAGIYDELEVFDAHTGNFLFCTITTSSASNQFSPDDNHLTVAKDKMVELVAPKSGKVTYIFYPKLPLAKPDDLLFLPDSKIAYLDSENAGFHIKFIDLIKKEIIKTISGTTIKYLKELKQVAIQRSQSHPTQDETFCLINKEYRYYYPSLQAVPIPDIAIHRNSLPTLPQPMQHVPEPIFLVTKVKNIFKKEIFKK